MAEIILLFLGEREPFKLLILRENNEVFFCFICTNSPALFLVLGEQDEALLNTPPVSRLFVLYGSHYKAKLSNIRSFITKLEVLSLLQMGEVRWEVLPGHSGFECCRVQPMKKYQICSRCIMDTTDPDIAFDYDGVCNHCHSYTLKVETRTFRGEEADIKRRDLVSQIKKKGFKKEYDCIVGVSGGVDSTYVAYLAKELGLRPLAIHFDNGWNSQLAVKNIENVLSKLSIDLYTYVIDWEEFKNLQISFLKSSTPDGEVPTDHAISALLFEEASKRGIKYILSGMNYATESGAVRRWAYGHSDWKYIRSVHNAFSSQKLSGYPHFNFFDLFYYTFIKKIKVVGILNYIDYNKDNAMKLLEDKLDWLYYGGKHYESIYTRFYQSYILPEKFNIDKRRLHLSDLIRSGQMTRSKALQEIEKPSCEPQLKESDRDYICKKLQLEPGDFEEIMASPLKTYEDYPNSYGVIKALKKLVNLLRSRGLYTK